MSAYRVRRPTEDAALARTARLPRYSLSSVFADMTTAHRLNDREGLRLLACRALRATSPEVGA